jgi:hypothetical protein
MKRPTGNPLRKLFQDRLRDESGAALLIALFLITTVTALSVAIGGVVLSQRVPTQIARKNFQTINAAEGGVEAALSRIRAASTGSTGVVTSLPCTSTYGATFSGSLGPDQGNLNYTATITYYWSDPSYASNRTTANQVKCSSSGNPTVPNYALITSAATGAGVGGLNTTDGDRSLEAVYNFSLTNANISGGPIPLFQSTFCMDASASPAVGTYVTMQPCVTGLPQQSWSYNKDLTISLTGMAQNTLCLQANPNNNTSTKIRLATCGTTNLQKWSFNAAGEYEGTDTSQNYNGYCLYSSATAGAQIGLTTSCNSGHDSVHTWAPDAKVGAGAAGASTNQLVNYKEFGRCLDDTGWDVNYAFLIDYPCKQTPNPANVDQNQVFTGPNANGQMVMAYNPNGNGPYCLQAGSKTTPPISGTLVQTKKCATNDNSQKWTSTGNTGNNATNYNYKTNNGLCLSIAPATASAIAGGLPWSQIIVETCDGSLKQKWNAPPLTAGAGLNNTWETTS